MATKRRGLGRGLDALLGDVAAPTRDVQGGADQELRMLAVQKLKPGPYQPRKNLDEEKLRGLADSIREQGIVQPIVVRAASNADHYEVIAGERRWRAAQLAGLREVPVIIRRVADRAALSIALIENIQREDLNPLEEANALARLLEEFSLSHQEVAEAVGRSRAAVSNLLRLRDLDEQVKTLLEAGDIDMGHGRALLGLEGEAQRRAAVQVRDRDMSVRETERLVRRLIDEEKRPPETTSPPTPDPDIRRFEAEMSEHLAARVTVQHTANGKGKLTIHYHSLDELDGIVERIKG